MPLSNVTIAIENDLMSPMNLTVVTTDSEGSFNTTFTVPAVAFDWYNITAGDGRARAR